MNLPWRSARQFGALLRRQRALLSHFSNDMEQARTSVVAYPPVPARHAESAAGPSSVNMRYQPVDFLLRKWQNVVVGGGPSQSRAVVSAELRPRHYYGEWRVSPALCRCFMLALRHPQTPYRAWMWTPWLIAISPMSPSFLVITPPGILEGSLYIAGCWSGLSKEHIYLALMLLK